MIKGVLLGLLLINMLGISFSLEPPKKSSTLIVLSEDSTIQEAINSAEEGDTIFVPAGTYHEHIIINKTVSLVGENRNTTIIDGDGKGTVIFVKAKNVCITGFTIQRSGNEISESGIHLKNSQNIFICNNTIKNCGIGIYLESSDNNLIQKNNLSDNKIGIELWYYQQNNTIKENVVIRNNMGIGLLTFSSHSIASKNIVMNNNIGFQVENSHDNLIINNLIENNSLYGIRLTNQWTQNNTISYNTIAENEFGIHSWMAQNNTIYNNNFIENTVQASIADMRPNTWSKTYPLGGNFWSDHPPKDKYLGVYQNETGSDGICDNPYIICSSNRDHYPLLGPISAFNVGNWSEFTETVDVVTNSTISGFQLNIVEKKISFMVTGPVESFGFCRIRIPKVILEDLWQNNCVILVDGTPPMVIYNSSDYANTYIYFLYFQAEHEIIIIQEFPYIVFLILLVLSPLIFTLILKKRFIKFINSDAQVHNENDY